MIVAFLGILKAGGAYVPIDPVSPIARRQQLANDAGVDLLLTRVTTTSQPDAYSVPVFSLDRLDAELQSLDNQNVDAPVSPEQAAYVIHTSGSTGAPKGVVVSQGVLSRHIQTAAAYGLNPSDRVLQFASVSFDVAAEEIWTTLSSGAPVVLQPCRPFDSMPAFVRFLDHHCITVAGIPAPYWHEWVCALQGEECAVPSSLRLLLVGNEPVSSSDLDQWRKRVGQSVRWINAYGPTETTITASLYESTLEFEHAEPHMVLIGRPLSGRSTYVLDPDLEPLPFGMPGELYIGGESLARGYLHDSARTADLFIPDPFSGRPGARLYKTGDRALVRCDGILEFLGRSDDQITLRGFRIEPREIEAQLCRHPIVQTAVVLASKEADGRSRLIAYVVSREPEQFNGPEIRRWLGTTLPEYMVPSMLVPLTELPRMPSGKVDRAALPASDWSGSTKQTTEAPLTSLQRQLASMWSEVLAVSWIGLHDNCLDLGGHSLLAVQLIARIQTIVDRPLALIDLFQCPTLAQLAERLEAEPQAASSEVVLLREGCDLPPLFCFDPDGTHVQAYRPLALSLEDGRLVYGLSMSHLFALRWQDVSILMLAERLAAVIRERQPRGPYHFVGWSNGGVLALATAQVLERGGEPMAFLGLLDTQPDHAFYAAQGPTPVQELMAYIRHDRREAFDAVPKAERDRLRQRLGSLGEEDRLETAMQWDRDHDFLSPEEAEASIGSLKVGYALAREAARYLAATRRHPIHAAIHAWWTTGTMSRRGKGPVEWTDHTTGPVSVDILTGDHMDAVYSIQAHQRIGEALAARKSALR